MNTQKGALRCLSLICLTVLGACGGGGGSAPAVVIPPLPPPEALSALGVITALDSATINGVRYETGVTTVTINGLLANVSDLELGQIVALEGEINFDDSTGTADEIAYSATVIGPVESIDAALSQLIVMGQTVLASVDTVFDPSIDPSNFDGLTVGSAAQISGFLNAAGGIVATRIEPDTTSTGVQLIGSIVGLDLANMLFSVNRLTVDYGSATLIDLPSGSPANGMFVMVRGTLADGILVVDEIESLFDPDGTPGERVHLGGVVTRFATASDFDLNGFPMTTGTNTGFGNGAIDDLRANAEITIDGEVTADGLSILANEITFGRLVDQTVTVPFDLSDFTEISVSTVFNVTVTQGPDFSVEVTIDEDVVDRVDVTQTGSTLNIALLPGDSNIETLEAVVTLPVLNNIELDGVVNVTLNDFEQTQLTVDVGGVSRLRGNSLVISDLAATVSGVSLLDFGDIRPIGNANIDVGGVSQATLNMDVGSALAGTVGTGQGTGVSILFYYGTDLILDVTTDGLSSVVKLGETRP